MKFSAKYLCLGLSLCVGNTYGWGIQGHQAVGYIAMEFLAPEASKFVATSLAGDKYHGSLGLAAPWPDEVRRTKGYEWSAMLHFVDVEDHPPNACSVDAKRDCPGNACILTAIANYTSRVVDNSLSASQQEEALKFITHFFGDIGQPLHNEGIAKGGNGIPVKCAGNQTNLHKTWDEGIINKMLEEKYNSSVGLWVDALTERIKTGDFQGSAGSWITCEPNQSLRRDVTFQVQVGEHSQVSFLENGIDCPLIWAKESNAFDCSFVWTYSLYDDLCSDANDYFSGAVPIIDLQIAKQGYRLAAWLNVLFDGKANLP
ncbi:hypothetical protein GYMLUDRAFT_186248 [Collybiopsis luxurians FD-317 M1]|nr:hypothetical protein GYMLUDRAFT_186248 [Collybiopsis luxurians FD-317 M1]